FRQGPDAIILSFDAAHHGLAPPILNHAFGNLGAGPVETIEGSRGDIPEELSAVGDHRRTKSIEYLYRYSAGMAAGPQQVRRHGADQHHFSDTARLGLRDTARDFAAAGRVSDMHGLLQIERLGERGDVGSISIHVVAHVRLRRSAMATTVMGDD